ncbi:MAG: Flp pilus assembly protein CpaB [Rhodospirillales bacterium]|nr:Flp pilus assembly protein CpaB [Rhodospirillales bacterium]
MRPLALVLILVALLISGATAFLAKRFLDDKSAQQAQAQAQAVAIAEILVAGRDIRTGTILKDTDLRYEKWPRHLVDPRFVGRTGNDDPKGNYVGSVAKRNLMAGEPMVASAVFRQDDAGMLAGMLTPGMRAVSVGITPTNAASGFVLPNDRVDALLSIELKVAGPDGGRAFSSEVILEDLRVLAVDTNLAPNEKTGPAAIPGKTVTLEVTPKQAEKLITAEMMGNLSLVLRSTADGAIAENAAHDFTLSWEVAKVLQGDPNLLVAKAKTQGEPEAAPAVETPTPSPPPRPVVQDRTVKVNRAGVVTSQTFAN